MWRPLSDQEGKTKYDFSCHQKDSMFSALWSMSLGSLFQRVGAALWNDDLYARVPFVCILREEQRERDGLYGAASSCRYCAQFYACAGFMQAKFMKGLGV